MGFEYDDAHYELNFADPKLQGLQVTVKSLSIGELLEMEDLLGQLAGDKASEAVKKLLAGLASSLISWNVERNGKAVPPTLAGVKGQNLNLVLGIIRAWLGVVADVPPPLPQSSNGTGRLDLEHSMPMAPLSPNPSS